MQEKSEKKQNRRWLVLNYTSLLVVLILFYAGKILQWPFIVVVGEIGFGVLFVWSFINAFISTKLWRFVHTSDKDLDEREMLVVLRSLKYSYSAFTILCLIIIYGFAIAGQGPIDVLMAGALLYLAHTLPAAIVGWQEI
jgi:cellulose synthase/poly-beta-1,6-N-acetylglucosamine synthase-like glycosyltransferase